MNSATAVIDFQALQHNVQRIRQLAPSSRLLAVVKANAYGHGLLKTAYILKAADCYGVARIDEALALRFGGVVKPILMLEGFVTTGDLPVLAAHSIETVVHCEEQLEALENAKLTHPLKVWMKLDCGLHRLGVRPEQAEAFYQRLSGSGNVEPPVNFISHFSHANEPSSGMMERQMTYFDAFVARKPGLQSLAASGGILLSSKAHRDMVRPGIILYGVSPFAGTYAESYQLKPAMTLKSSLIAVREHKAGEAVGYGGCWVSARDTRLGVVAIGYGDGYPLSAPSGTPVLLNGREVPLVGRVSMDMLSVDLGPGAQDSVGDEVVLWNADLPVEKVAAYMGISAYELIATLTSRVAIEYRGG